MGLSDELQDGIGSLWERVVTHPFIIELGDGTLPRKSSTCISNRTTCL